jgi:murein L,D-transpeptidase YcbB/YkuD
LRLPAASEAVVVTLPQIAKGRRLRRRVWACRGAAARVAGWVLAVAAAGAAVPGGGSAAVVTAALQPPAAAAPAAADAAGAVSPIRGRLESAAPLVFAGEPLHAALLRRFYAAHDYRPVWPTYPAQAQALLGAVMDAGAQGLDPDLFHAPLLRHPAALPPLDRELLLSDAFLSYADALARGVLPVDIRMDDEDLTPPPFDVAAVLDEAIASPDPAAAIAALAPQSPAYLALRRALQRYRSEAAAAADPAAAARVHDIEVNLERLRWLPRRLPPDRVWVNTATAQLTLYRAARAVFTTRVVVGQVSKQTPEFTSTIDSVLFNPPWNVPPSIARAEILPKLDEDPDYLARHHMVWRANGTIQQLPPSALGRLKFEMADRFDVYLHDTPERFLFRRADRRKSHGCVRVQHPRALAALLFDEPVAAIDRAIARGITYARALPAPIPVFIVYQTAFLDPAGRIAFVPDVYHRDAEIWQRLHPIHQAPVAQHQPGERNG